MSAWCCVCHNDPCDGLDCGVYLPWGAPRKKRVVDPATFSVERGRAWVTRRAKYGERGHR